MNAVSKLTRFIKPYWKWAVVAPFLMMIEVAMDLLQPHMVERFVDEGIARLDLTLVLHTGLLTFGIAVIGAIGGMSNGIFAERVVQGYGADLREALFRKVQAFSFGNLDELETGQLITRLTNDVTQTQDALLMILRIPGPCSPITDRKSNHGDRYKPTTGIPAVNPDADRLAATTAGAARTNINSGI